MQCMVDDTFLDTSGSKIKRIELSEQRTANLCPDNGTITAYLNVENSTVAVYCDKHASYGTTMGDIVTREKLYAALKTSGKKVSM